MSVLLAAGGTGGHVYPALALARELRERGVEVAWIGRGGGLEETAARDDGIRFFGVRAGKLDRHRPNPRALLRAAAGFLDAHRVVRQVRPHSLVAFGGFASFPGTAAAAMLGVPIVLHEANVQPGLVTRVFAARAARIAVADMAARSRLPSKKVVWVGMPVREEVVARDAALGALGLEPSVPIVLIMPGSQGSMKLNRLLPPLLERIFADRRVQILHVTGPGRLDEVRPRVVHLPWYHTAERVHGPSAYAAAEVAITRAGMGTLADAAFHGVPLLMIPLPHASENHQRQNAEAVVARGAGVLISEEQLEREVAVTPALSSEFETGILSCLSAERNREMRSAARAASPIGAAARLAELVLGIQTSAARRGFS